MQSKDIYEEIKMRNEVLAKARPFSGFQLQQVKDFFRDETTWSSNALEGNTLDINETAILLKDGMTVRGHSVREIHECLGHARAYDFMFSLHEKHTIGEEDIKQLHALFAIYMDDIKPGIYRNENVIIAGSRHPLPPHENVPGLMKDFVSWMDENRAKMDSVVFAAEAHRRFVYIHPFLDGNGRVARLLMNTILLQESYLPASIPPIRKLDYCVALENGHKSPDKFNDFIAEMELMTLTDYMRMLNISFDKDMLKRGTSENVQNDETGKALLDRFVSTAVKHRRSMGLKASIDAACREVIGNDKPQAVIRKSKMDDYLKFIGKSGIMEYVTEQVKDASAKKRTAQKQRRGI